MIRRPNPMGLRLVPSPEQRRAAELRRERAVFVIVCVVALVVVALDVFVWRAS